MQAGAPNVGTLLAGRIVAGIAIGYALVKTFVLMALRPKSFPKPRWAWFFLPHLLTSVTAIEPPLIITFQHPFHDSAIIQREPFMDNPLSVQSVMTDPACLFFGLLPRPGLTLS